MKSLRVLSALINFCHRSSAALLLFSLFSFGGIAVAPASTSAPAPTEWVAPATNRKPTRILRIFLTRVVTRCVADFSFLQLLNHHRHLVQACCRVMTSICEQIERPIRIIKPTATTIPDSVLSKLSQA